LLCLLGIAISCGERRCHIRSITLNRNEPVNFECISSGMNMALLAPDLV